MMNIFIVSARRSGTHLLTDLIINNFGYKRIDNQLDFDFLSRGNVTEFIREMSLGNRLAWTHAHDFDTMFDKNLDPEQIEELKAIFYSSKILYVYRDIRDVITSYYHRPYNFNAFESFGDFYHYNNMRDYVSMNNYTGNHNNLVDVLIDQHKNWFSVYMARELVGLDIEVISFKEIVTEYLYSAILVGKFLGLEDVPIERIKDVRLKSLDDKKPDIIYTSNDFRSGRIGDWVKTFGIEWGMEIRELYDDLVGYHVQQHIHMRKLHDYHDPELKYYQTYSRNWKELEKEVDLELKEYGGKYDNGDAINFELLIEKRYLKMGRMSNDVRYKHKVFFAGRYVIKFLFPCKAALDKKTFDHVIPIASKKNLLTILKTNERLQALNIVPRLHYAGIHKGILVVVQDRIHRQNFVYEKHNIKSKIDWEWMVRFDIFPDIIELFQKALAENIVFSDIISPHNLAYLGTNLTCVDLDGISYFDNTEDLKSSKEYKNMISILSVVNEKWAEKHGKMIEI